MLQIPMDVNDDLTCLAAAETPVEEVEAVEARGKKQYERDFLLQLQKNPLPH